MELMSTLSPLLGILPQVHQNSALQFFVEGAANDGGYLVHNFLMTAKSTTSGSGCSKLSSSSAVSTCFFPETKALMMSVSCMQSNGRHLKVFCSYHDTFSTSIICMMVIG